MIYRIAKPSDYKKIADLHYKVRNTYSVGYFSQMGRAFLREYYRIILNDPYEIVVCAETDDGAIVGLNSATIDVKKQFERMRRYKWRLAIFAIPSFIKKPSLIRKTWERFKATKGDDSEKYIPNDGARNEYWTWDAKVKDPLSSVQFSSIMPKIQYALGVKEVIGEVDEVNDKVLKFNLKTGHELVRRVKLPDGRTRLILRLDLEKKFASK